MLKARRPAAISFVVGESRPRTVGRTVGRLSRRRTVGPKQPSRWACQQPRGGGPRRGRAIHGSMAIRSSRELMRS
eukprot:SAG25_NODE_1474_length_2946_cov_3.155899_4_plen_75_part_00